MKHIEILNGLLKSASEIKNETVSREKKKIDQAFDIWGSLVNWGDLFLNISSKAEASWMLSIEATQDVWSSIFLAIHGFYRLGMISLRSCFELLLIGVYFDHNLRDYERWSADEKNAPRPSFGKVTKWIFSNLLSFKQFDKKYGLKRELNDFYDELSGFMHARGDRQEILKSPTRVLHGLTRHSYTKESFDQWHQKLLQMFGLCNVVFMLKHPVVRKDPKKAPFSDPKAAGELISKVSTERTKQLNVVLVNEVP